MNIRLRNILVFTGLVALLTAVGLAALLSSNDAPATAELKPLPYVMVAARPIAAGSRIAKADVSWKQVDETAVPAAAIVRSDLSEVEVIGALALRNLLPGEMLADKDFARTPGAGTLAAALNPGWRAVTITATAAQTSAGMLLPNDRVDLLLSSAPSGAGQVNVTLPFTQSNGAALGVATAIITNVRVIAINGSTMVEEGGNDMSKSGAEDGGTVTLELLPEQVGMVLSAATSGQIAISLRSRLDGQGMAAQTVIPPLAKKTAVTAPAPYDPPALQGKPARPLSSVTIIRGGAKKSVE